MGPCVYGRIVAVDVSDILPRGRLSTRQVLIQKVQRNFESMRIISVHAADEPALAGSAGENGVLADSAVDDFCIVPDRGDMVEELQLRLIADDILTASGAAGPPRGTRRPVV